jgi:hypothetical protein
MGYFQQFQRFVAALVDVDIKDKTPVTSAKTDVCIWPLLPPLADLSFVLARAVKAMLDAGMFTGIPACASALAGAGKRSIRTLSYLEEWEYKASSSSIEKSPPQESFGFDI